VILDHVFAKGTVSLLLDGRPVGVAGGSHWLADDPLVTAHPGAFTRDCRYGLSFSGEAPAVLSVPPDEEDDLPVRGHRRPQVARGAAR